MSFETSDIATAAYLLMKGFKLKSAENLPGKYSFVFEDPDSKAKLACIEFLNSDCSKFDNHLRALRGILRAGKK